MTELIRIYQADLYRILKNRALLFTVFAPQLVVLSLAILQLEKTLDLSTSGYDIWVIFSSDILLTLTIVIPLLSIIYPYVVFENEHRYNGLRTHSILPINFGAYFLSKMIVIWTFIVFVILTSTVMMTILGYAIGGIYRIKEFILYPPVFLFQYAFASIFVCLFLSVFHVILNIVVKNILINTLPFVLLIFMSFFLTKSEYACLIPHAYPFVVLSGLHLNQTLHLDYTVLVSFCCTILSIYILYLLPKRIQHIWMK